MAKQIKIEIEQTETHKFYTRTTKIIEINICNGHWKYWDDTMEATPEEKITLTMNNIRDSRYLALPVRDVYSIYDSEAWEENREIQVKEASVRMYDSLHEYLVCRINNAKKSWLKEENYTAVLFDEKYHNYKHDEILDEIIYEDTGLIEIKITKDDGIE